ncbi:Odorant receptor 131 [Halyomorpha halys]|nr:Odorant receptor 131 [Halyomorpha halys]
MNAVALSFMLMGAYSQLFLYCSSGQLLTTEFEKVHGAVFDNRWYRSKPSIRKSMVMMGIRSQKLVIVKNYRIFTALHTTFLQSCQESFSYFIVFRTLAANIKLS